STARSSGTIAPRLGTSVTSPSRSSSRSASRTGARLKPSSSASGISLMRSPGLRRPLTIASRIAISARSTLEGAGPLDDMELGRERPAVEALGAHRRDVHERRAAEHQVAQDLAGRRALEEAVAGEAGRVEEAADRLVLADHRVVVR